MPGYLFKEGDELSRGELVQLPRVLHLVQLPVQVLNLYKKWKLEKAKHEEDFKKLEMEYKTEIERVRQLNIQIKMMMAENTWLKVSLKQSHDEYLKDMEKWVCTIV